MIGNVDRPVADQGVHSKYFEIKNIHTFTFTKFVELYSPLYRLVLHIYLKSKISLPWAHGLVNTDVACWSVQGFVSVTHCLIYRPYFSK